MNSIIMKGNIIALQRKKEKRKERKERVSSY